MESLVVSRSSLGARAVAALLAVLICLGSAFLWIGIPLGMFLLAGELTSSAQGFLFFVLGGIPFAMIGFGWLLYRLNSIYEGARGGPPRTTAPRSAWLVASSDERNKLRRKRAPRSLIDAAMTTSAFVALVLLLVWFFFFASMHLAPMQ
jgi:hypothetical protein